MTSIMNIIIPLHILLHCICTFHHFPPSLSILVGLQNRVNNTKTEHFAVNDPVNRQTAITKQETPCQTTSNENPLNEVYVHGNLDRDSSPECKPRVQRKSF